MRAQDYTILSLSVNEYLCEEWLCLKPTHHLLFHSMKSAAYLAKRQKLTRIYSFLDLTGKR